MNIISRLRSFLGISAPLRNRAGGLAYITDSEHGLYGRIVTTVRVDERRHWWVDPPQPCTLTNGPYVTEEGVVVHAGDAVRLLGIHDNHLRPIGSPGEGERDESLNWLPVPPVLIPLKVKGEVS